MTRAAWTASLVAASACSLVVDTDGLAGDGGTRAGDGGFLARDGGGDDLVDGGGDAPFRSGDSGAVVQDVPSSIDGLELWLRSDGTATGNTATWLDLAGNHDVRAGDGCAAPAFVAGARNGLPAMRFNGSTTCLSFSDGFADFSQGLTAVVVMATSKDAPSREAAILDLALPEANAGEILITSTGPGGDIAYTTSDTSSDTERVTAAGAFTTDWHFYTFVEDESFGGAPPGIPSSIMISRDGETIAGGAVHAIPQGKRTTAYLGRGSGSSRLQADIGELIVYRRALDPLEVRRLEAYVKARWGT